MVHPQEVSQWEALVSSRLPELSAPQARGLAQWSLGIVLSNCATLTRVVGIIARLLRQKPASVRQRLREWGYEAGQKEGEHRRCVEVEGCFVWLLRWIVALWPAQDRQIAWALDATTLGKRFTVLTISVLYHGCALPVAWKILAAEEVGPWQPHWLDLLDRLAGAIPPDWLVLVLADRGLYAKWLYEAIQQRGWHPFLRINRGGKYRRKGQESFVGLSTLLSHMGQRWKGQLECFAGRKERLACTLLACWEPGHQDGWLIVTDLPPSQANVAWYRMRSWIEQSFKDLKRGGWQWQRTRACDPERVSRLTVVGPGSSQHLDALPQRHIARQTAKGRPAPRQRSCFALGQEEVRVSLLRDHQVRLAPLIGEPWPTQLAPARLPAPPKTGLGDPQTQRTRKKRAEHKRKAARRASHEASG
jgi:Transposase DDE domain